MSEKYSLLYPNTEAKYVTIGQTVMHDLGLDLICKQLSPKETEQNYFLNVLSKITSDPHVILYRCDVFDDILHNREMREQLLTILDKINFLRNYGGLNKAFDESSTIWDLMHRLDELNDYIKCVEALHECLSERDIKSEGLTGLRAYVERIYTDNGFAQLKEDISKLNFDTSNLKSITVGINLNERFEAEGIGLISVNSKSFSKSNVISNFCDHISSKDKIKPDNEWNEGYKYHQLESQDFASVAEGDSTRGVTFYMDRVVNQMISGMVRKIKDVLNMYVSVTITNMTDLIPELVYYVKWAEFIEQLSDRGMTFSKAEVLDKSDSGEENFAMKARGVYNIKLAAHPEAEAQSIVLNDLDFDSEHRLYILTGANRGGKTTISQAIGQLFVLAQGGIYIPGKSFSFSPVDCVFTHFPADEDKTFDLGRLGEECKRFKEIFNQATAKSLILMNETFSTTSFEEGYHIAKDSVRALLSKGSRTIYNTHMHKLANDIDEINSEGNKGKAFSLIVHNEGENRSYKIEVAPPFGKSFASDIARKYGVTYEMLLGQTKKSSIINSPQIEISSIINSPHGFSTRIGGVSTGVFESLNLGMNRGDDAESVKENWRRFMAAAGIPNIPFVCGKQVHENNVHVASVADARPAYGKGELVVADGYVTNEINLPLAIFTADCVPVLLEDSVAGVVGAVHCGWRSTVADIEGKAIEKMKSLGSIVQNIKVAIGPAINQCCFEVGPEVIEAVESLIGRNEAKEFYYIKQNGKAMLDLKGVVAKRMRELGVPDENIELVGECTMCHPEKYYSHRYSNGSRGSLACIIMKK